MILSAIYCLVAGGAPPVMSYGLVAAVQIVLPTFVAWTERG